MQRALTPITISLLLFAGCDFKGGDDLPDVADDGGDSYSTGEVPPDQSTGVVTTSGGSQPHSDSGDTESPATSAASTGEASDTQTPVSTTSCPSEHTDSGDTETPVTSTTLFPGGETDTEGDDSHGYTTGVVEPECGWGAGGNEDGTWCALSIHCDGQPVRAMQCDTQICVCLVDDIEVGTCEADEVCLHFANIKDRAPACCGFAPIED